MADFDDDANPLDERGKKDEATGGDDDDETIPLIPRGTQIDPYGNESGEQETPFGVGALVTSLRNEVLKERVKGLYDRLSEHLGQKPKVLHYDLFELKGKTLYYVGPDKNLEKKLLTAMGSLRTGDALQRILGKKGLREMGFDIPKSSVSARKALMEMPSASDIGKANEIEMQDLMGKAIAANEDLIREISSDRGTQTGEDDPEMPTMRELVGLDKELRSI